MGDPDGIDRRTLARAIKRFDPVWELRRAERLGTGPLATYRVTVETPGDDATWILKVTPAGDVDRVSTEARLLALLGETDLPVPAVRGAVDDDPDLPTPLVMLHELPGRTIRRTDIDSIDDELLEALAYQSGEHLAALHRLDVVDRFGYLEPRGPSYDGGVPPADPSAIGVADATDRWRDRLSADLDPVVAGLEDGPFTDVAERAQRELEDRFEALVGPFEPVLARIDQSIENLRIMGDRVVGLLDWEFTLAATPGYDLEHVSWSLAGGPFLYGSDIADRRELIRSQVLAGYADADGRGDPERMRANRSCYELLIAARSMQLFEEWDELFDLDVSNDQLQSSLRDEFRTLVEE